MSLGIYLVSGLDRLGIIEIIRDINVYPEQRGRKALELVAAGVSEEGGPYCRHLDSEAEMKSFDATCKNLPQFLNRDKLTG